MNLNAKLKRFTPYYKPHMRLFSADIVCAILAALCDLFYPMLTREIINVYIPQKQLMTIIILSGALLLIYLLKLGFNYFMMYYGHVMGLRMQADMRTDLFRHLNRLPFNYFDNNKTGVIMGRITNDLFEITELAHHGPEDILISFLMLVGSFVLLCMINVPLTLIIFAFIPILILFSMKKRLRLKEAFEKSRKEYAEINSGVENSISGIRVVKAFTSGAHEADKFNVLNNRFKVAKVGAYKVMAEFFSGNNFVLDLLGIIVLLAGGLFVYYGEITFGDFAAYVLYITMFVNPIKKLINFVELWQQGMSGFDRFCEIMDEQPEADNEGAVELKNVKGDLEYKNVGFSYDEGKEVFSGIDIKISAGKTVALVGTSGGGKTTLCHLLPRFYEPTNGQILLDGTDITHFTRQSLRQKIGIVSQDVFLFNDTILENILYGRADAAIDEVKDAARRAGIHEYIESMPQGYETLVGERGVKLSGGQKQRIAIARVFLKNPPILILDEATSALDNITEAYIQKSLLELMEGRTTIVVAHRLSTVKHADEIIVLSDEGILQRGKHSELIRQDGVYKVLYEAQFKE